MFQPWCAHHVLMWVYLTDSSAKALQATGAQTLLGCGPRTDVDFAQRSQLAYMRGMSRKMTTKRSRLRDGVADEPLFPMAVGLCGAARWLPWPIPLLNADAGSVIVRVASDSGRIVCA